jgi:hypothetical protein
LPLALAAEASRCYNASRNQPMADWKQITARIRRARTGKDPAAQLSNLYEKTQDAMVAFELARHFETASQNAEAAKWYTTAAARFRRADWKTKAQEAAVRLGGEAPLLESQSDLPAIAPSLTIPEPGLPFEQSATVFEAIIAPSEQDEQASDEQLEVPSGAASASKPAAEGPRRRRGRRGGRNRRKGSVTRETPAASTQQDGAGPSSSGASVSAPPEDSVEPRTSRSSESVMPRLPVEPMGDAGGIALRGRYGDPGLSSRLSLLEMQFRRLLTCAPVKLDEADRAPAGPGVFLVTDSDLTSYYYVEACQTLRIAIPNLLRGGSSRRGADSIKPQLASHLGIAETRVGKYLADHCVVRWLQLDEGASHFAHFVISVLRPVLNE